jgi:DNA-binding MurR/RpiR family transcriptional regulator
VSSTVADRIAQSGATLTTAERRVAESVLTDPQRVAFGTVADLAESASAGAATVVRLAAKLGFDGFTALQSAVQMELARQLRPAAERIRQPAADDVLARQSQLEVVNVQATLSGVDSTALDEVVTHLASMGSRVFVLSGDASRGVAQQFVGDLGLLRDEVSLIDGNEVAVRRQVALLRTTDVVVVLDLRRYDRWLVDAVETAAGNGAWIVAVVDSVLSPLASTAARTLTVSAAGSGPFDSHVGTLALLNAACTAVADRLRAAATERLDRIERAWADSGALTDR